MKKIFAVAVAAILGVSAFAQQGDKSLGARLLYGSDIERLGIGIVGQYGFQDDVRGEASIGYYPGDNTAVFEINVNAHYLLGNDSMTVYPLAGINFTHLENFSTKPGLNLGAGIEFPLTYSLNFVAEVKYVISKYDQFVLGAGVNFKF